MRFFHSFPRSKRQRPDDGVVHGNREELLASHANAQTVLNLILRHGLLCTPEDLEVFPDPETRNENKKERLQAGEPEHIHKQSRFCVTLCTERELYQRSIRGLPSRSEVPGTDVVEKSHADLFGPYAIGLDPIEARRLGIVPTFYYSPSDVFGNRFVGGRKVPGLNIQIIQRLKEIRELMILLAMFESNLTIGDNGPRVGEVLRALKLDLPFQPQNVAAFHALSEATRARILDVFDTDRELAVNLVSFTEMMLSLFQETDSNKDLTPLAFYQQREWRLIHHMRDGMEWYCLGQQPYFRDRLQHERASQVGLLTRQIAGGRPRDEDYLAHCWVLESVDGRPIRDFVSIVIVPHEIEDQTRGLVRSTGCSAEVAAAEDFGYTPEIAASAKGSSREASVSRRASTEAL